MAEDREALLQHYRRMRTDLLHAIEGLSDEQMTEPSLDGWSVKDHLSHLAFWDDIRTSEVLRFSAGHYSAWRTRGQQDQTMNAIAHDLRVDLSLEQTKWEPAASRRRLEDAIKAATGRGLEASLYGEAALRSTHEATHTGWIKRWRREKGIPVPE